MGNKNQRPETKVKIIDGEENLKDIITELIERELIQMIQREED